tara:strand:+ start:281 stop:919 length:639 start_codon:yes stop_codon:yes gene_type:complete
MSNPIKLAMDLEAMEPDNTKATSKPIGRRIKNLKTLEPDLRYGVPIKDYRALNMDSYKDIIRKAGVVPESFPANAFFAHHEGSEWIPNAKSPAEKLKTKRKILDKMSMGDVPGGLIAYVTEKEDPEGVAYGAYYPAYNDINPDTIRIYGGEEQDRTALHEPLHVEFGHNRDNLSQSRYDEGEKEMLETLKRYQKIYKGDIPDSLFARLFRGE